MTIIRGGKKHDVAFQKLTEYMSTDLDGGKAFEMSPVLIGKII